MGGKVRDFSIMGLDAGNAWVKAVTDECSIRFPHALRAYTQAQAEEANMRGGVDDPNAYTVDGTIYAIGEKARRMGDGSVKYKEDRYNSQYYGVLAAIAMFQAFNTDKRDVYILGTHTPVDLPFRKDLIAAIVRRQPWVVENQGVRKVFYIAKATGGDEPVMAFRHATISDSLSKRGEPRIWSGDTLVIDIGGFTTGMAIVNKGIVDYDSAQSRVRGVLDVLDDLETMLWQNHRHKLQGAKKLSQSRLEDAIKTGYYNAGGVGVLDVRKEVDEACNVLLSDIKNFFSEYGGAAEFDAILLAGGGGALMEKKLRENLGHQFVYVAEMNRDRMQFATSTGAYKVLKLLQIRGELS